MHTAEDLKQDLIEHLLSMDKSVMSMEQLGGYIYAVQKVLDMDKPDPFLPLYNGLRNGLNPRCAIQSEVKANG